VYGVRGVVGDESDEREPERGPFIGGGDL
jgi:hypothetical protein